MTAPLADIITQVETQLAQARAAAGSLGDDPMAYHRRFNGEMVLLVDRLFMQFGARANTRHDSAKFTMAGITASSTQGLGQALANWIAAARKRVLPA